jgi:hypothetical protein
LTLSYFDIHLNRKKGSDVSFIASGRALSAIGTFAALKA